MTPKSHNNFLVQEHPKTMEQINHLLRNNDLAIPKATKGPQPNRATALEKKRKYFLKKEVFTV